MISVCIATYNGERYIGDQLTSILSQLSDADEIVISDDGSTDGTLQVIKEICDKRIKIYHHHKQKPNLILIMQHTIMRMRYCMQREM